MRTLHCPRALAAGLAATAFAGCDGLPLAYDVLASGRGIDTTDYEHARWRISDPPRYSVEGETVLDARTGLRWERATAGALGWEAADERCSTLELAGRGDWRLPTRIELVSLLEHGRAGTNTAAIDPEAFPETARGEYWSASRPPQFADLVYVVGFAQGHSKPDRLAGPYASRCVRTDTPRADGPVVASSGGIIVDEWTGLRWEARPSDASVPYDGHANDCAGRNVNGATGWRVPTAPELLTITDPLRTEPPLLREAWLGAAPIEYWSATPNTVAGLYQWALKTDNGELTTRARDGIDNVPPAFWCVKGPQ